jgi:uncharacterized membrane protein
MVTQVYSDGHLAAAASCVDGITPSSSAQGARWQSRDDVDGRLRFLDGLRGVELILMVINHTSRDWMDVGMGWARYHLVYGSLILPASIFLFVAGFCLPISYYLRRESEGFLRDLRKYFRRGIGHCCWVHLNVTKQPATRAT